MAPGLSIINQKLSPVLSMINEKLAPVLSIANEKLSPGWSIIKGNWASVLSFIIEKLNAPIVDLML